MANPESAKRRSAGYTASAICGASRALDRLINFHEIQRPCAAIVRNLFDFSAASLTIRPKSSED